MEYADGVYHPPSSDVTDYGVTRVMNRGCRAPGHAIPKSED